MTQTNGRYDTFTALGNAGRSADVDAIMDTLITGSDIAATRLADYALGLVDTREGVARIRHYLFQGTPIQRNYAALYFKRRGRVGLLEEAVAQGKIDAIQAYSR